MYRDNESGLHILEIEITNRCNLLCKHCYVEKDEIKDMRYEEVISIIDESNKLKINRLVFTGGEPLLYRKIFKLAKYAKALGIPEIALLTNGLLIDCDNVDELSFFDIVQMSLDLNSNKQQKIRLNYSNIIIEKAKLLKSRNIRPHFYTTLYKSNVAFLKNFIDIANSIDVSLSFNKIVPINNDLKEECLSKSEYIKLLKDIVKYKKKGFNIKCSLPHLFLVDDEKLTRLKNYPGNGIIGGCIAGIAALYIDVHGNVYPCPFVKIACGKIGTNTLEGIWENSHFLKRIRKRKDYIGNCGKCEYINFCGGCRASSLLTYGNPFASDPYCFHDSSK